MPFSTREMAAATGTIVAYVVPKEHHGIGISFFSLSTALALAMGPFLGVTLVQIVTYPQLFGICLAVGCVSLVCYVVLGVILGGAGVYDKLVDFAGAGATVPLTGFGNTLAKGVREAVKEQGILGALTGGLKASAAGIAAAVFFGFLAALLCNPKDKS